MEIINKVGDRYSVSIKEDDVFLLQNSVNFALEYYHADRGRIDGYLAGEQIDKNTHDKMIWNNTVKITQFENLLKSLRKIEEK